MPPSPKKRTSLSWWILAAIAIIAVVWLTIATIAANIAASPSGFSAVYLTSGEVLVGKLSLSATPTLTDAWVVDHSSSTAPEGQGPVNLIPFSTTSVSPENTVHISAQQILYWANIDPASILAKQLEAKTE